jgi:DNA-nicking Smr family endonuclease
MARRTLSRGELELWAHVAGKVRPLPGRAAPTLPPAPDPPPKPAAPREAPSSAAAPTRPQAPAPRPPLAPIERRLLRQVTRGQREVDAAIDLHGLRQADAHRALLRFVERAHHDGAKLVLVVTGKGLPDPVPFAENERGVLRRLVPIWLSEPALRRHVLGFEEAARGHGGAGALYVRIRRARP